MQKSLEMLQVVCFFGTPYERAVNLQCTWDADPMMDISKD